MTKKQQRFREEAMKITVTEDFIPILTATIVEAQDISLLNHVPHYVARAVLDELLESRGRRENADALIVSIILEQGWLKR